jgi:transglutaminase-like putative cysteine protease
MNKLQFSLLLIPCCFIPFTFIHAVEPDAEIRLYSTICAVREDKLAETDTIIIQINNRNGEKYCDVEIFFDKSDPLSRFSAWIADTNGIVIRELKKQDYKDENETDDNTLYQDDFVRKFTLKHNVYPYCIGYTYQSVSKQFLGIAQWSPVIDTDVPTRKARLTVQYPDNYQLHIFEKNITSFPAAQSAGYSSRSWNTSYNGSLKKEAYCPAFWNFLPFVKIIPVLFTYGIGGSTDTWQTFGEWQYNLNQGLDELPLSEREKISYLTSQIKDKKEVIKVLYHYLQDNTRYVNVSLGIGGMKPYPAEYVSNNKYGDCKALTNYMKALLHYAGIESYYSTIYASGQPREVITEIPGQQFNHVILAVPLGNDTLWLENTSNTNPFGYTGTYTQNRQALLVDAGKSKLVRTPSLKEKDVQVTTRMEFFLDFEGNAKTNLSFNYRGDKFETYNSLYTQYNHDIQNTYVHDHMPFQAFELNDWTLVKKDRDDLNILLKSSVSVKRVLKVIGSERYFSILPSDIPDFTTPKSRKLPVQLPYPLYMTDTLIYHLPFTGKVVLPDSINREGKFGLYHLKFRCDGNTITVFRNFLIYAGNISLTEYNDFYSFLTSIKTDEKRKILIQTL